MSPDDIFAAQFWPWPDPAIKRDPQGRVLFVNAAFLALYGGRVEDWRGNAVGGWPAPQVNPYRFETRLAAADGSEQVYDWREQTLADGNAFALARNVTVFTHSPQPDPANTAVPEVGFEDPAHQAQIQTQTHDLATQDAHSPVHAPVYHAETAQVDMEPPHVEAPAFSAPPIGTSAPELASAPHLDAAVEAPVAEAPVAEADPIVVPEIEIPSIDIPSDDAYAMTDIPVAEPAAISPPAEREFERRALPIEDESAVLGNNWRDAVIAKAVGADDVAPDAAAGKAATHEPAPTTDALEPSDGSGPIRILLAEDNAINALLTRTLLEAEGHTVETVEDGALAVEAVKTAKYDLIFMDMRMPNMDGLEATRKIRTLPNVSRVLPIIALTANAFDDDRNACFDSGMNDFMTKPVSAEELSEKVRDWTSEDAKSRMLKAA